MGIILKNRKWIVTACLILLAGAAAGCGIGKKGTVAGTRYYHPQTEMTEKTETTEKCVETEAVFTPDMYLIIRNDMSTEHMILEQLASGKQYLYEYSLATSFLDKYGNAAPAAEFRPGRVIIVGGKDSKGKLKKAQISDKVWEYEKIIRYEIDEERHIFEISDTKYLFREDVFAVSDEERIKLSDIGEADELCVVGMNKEILSVSVTTGHGSISLKNTDIFEGSFIQVGRKIFAEITGEISLEVPEGTYMVTVANKGYGGSKEVTVARGEVTVLDLEEWKGEGPKKGEIRFEISDEEGNKADAELRIDGKAVEYEEAQKLDYGIHSIEVTAAGFENYSKKLFVNSKEAVIRIALSKEGEIQEKVSDPSEKTEDTEQKTDSESKSETEQREEWKEELMTDYLSTFTELLGNLYN